MKAHAWWIGLALPLLAQTRQFTPADAIRAEWARQPLAWTEVQKAALSPSDRGRLERTLARIGAAGAPSFVPPEFEKPAVEAWEAKARAARTPQARFDALFALGRLKSPRALQALDGLTPADAETWPKHLHLEAAIATARLQGAELSPAHQAFLDALQRSGRVDPVRAQAARLRLVMAGKEKELLPAVRATPGALLALLDAWNRGPWESRAKAHAGMLLDPLLPGSGVAGLKSAYQALGLSAEGPDPQSASPAPLDPKWLPASRLFEGLGRPAPDSAWPAVKAAALGRSDPSDAHGRPDRMLRAAAIAALPKFAGGEARAVAEAMAQHPDPFVLAALLPALRAMDSPAADDLRARLLGGSDPIARSAAIEDLPAAPPDLDALASRVWSESQFETQQTLIQSYARWKLPPEVQKNLLRPWLRHPDWTCRWEAFQALRKLEPDAPWPAAPKPGKTDAAILAEAIRLAERGQPVRLRITFSGRRQVTLRLDPTVAPMNVANLVLLARRGYFDGRRVPRVVPDFVVQMGSPFDTMDGGPGYTVRCENSPDWYGPGSVGMALSGKDTGGSQFFITTNATPHLTGRYTRLGELEDPDRTLPMLDGLELGATIRSIRVVGR